LLSHTSPLQTTLCCDFPTNLLLSPVDPLGREDVLLSLVPNPFFFFLHGFPVLDSFSLVGHSLLILDAVFPPLLRSPRSSSRASPCPSRFTFVRFSLNQPLFWALSTVSSCSLSVSGSCIRLFLRVHLLRLTSFLPGWQHSISRGKCHETSPQALFPMPTVDHPLFTFLSRYPLPVFQNNLFPRVSFRLSFPNAPLSFPVPSMFWVPSGPFFPSHSSSSQQSSGFFRSCFSPAERRNFCFFSCCITHLQSSHLSFLVPPPLPFFFFIPKRWVPRHAAGRPLAFSGLCPPCGGQKEVNPDPHTLLGPFFVSQSWEFEVFLIHLPAFRWSFCRSNKFEAVATFL